MTTRKLRSYRTSRAAALALAVSAIVVASSAVATPAAAHSCKTKFNHCVKLCDTKYGTPATCVQKSCTPRLEACHAGKPDKKHHAKRDPKDPNPKTTGDKSDPKTPPTTDGKAPSKPVFDGTEEGRVDPNKPKGTDDARQPKGGAGTDPGKPPKTAGTEEGRPGKPLRPKDERPPKTQGDSKGPYPKKHGDSKGHHPKQPKSDDSRPSQTKDVSRGPQKQVRVGDVRPRERPFQARAQFQGQGTRGSGGNGGGGRGGRR